MKFNFFLASISLFLFLAGCNKPNPNPENIDPIFQSLQAEKKSAEQTLVAEKKTLEENIAAYEKVKPQTGQYKYAIKKVYDSKARVEKLEQLVKYLEIRSESRIKEAREKYLIAFNKNEAWPDPKEYENYKTMKRLESAPKNWDAKRRMEEAKSESMKKSSAQAEKK